LIGLAHEQAAAVMVAAADQQTLGTQHLRGVITVESSPVASRTNSTDQITQVHYGIAALAEDLARYRSAPSVVGVTPKYQLFYWHHALSVSHQAYPQDLVRFSTRSVHDISEGEARCLASRNRWNYRQYVVFCNRVIRPGECLVSCDTQARSVRGQVRITLNQPADKLFNVRYGARQLSGLARLANHIPSTCKIE
jgi:hypothetical protein